MRGVVERGDFVKGCCGERVKVCGVGGGDFERGRLGVK